jgi:hypothetical protein
MIARRDFVSVRPTGWISLARQRSVTGMTTATRETRLAALPVRRHRPRAWRLGRLLLCLALAPRGGVHAQSRTEPAEVFVVATLYHRHAVVPAYGHDSLRAVIERIEPDVVVLDVSPRELREESVHPSKAEYPRVVFPLVRAHRYRAYAGEPDEPRFGEIVGRLARRLEAFRAEQPAAARADEAYERATYAALAQLWRTPADVNGATTDRLLLARRAYQDRLAGPEVADAWHEWNDHAVEMVRIAIRKNRDQRVLVLVGVENAASIRAALRASSEVHLVDVEAWLRGHGP